MKPAGLQFDQPSKVYYYDAGKLNLKRGDRVVVKTDQGLTLARVSLLANDQGFNPPQKSRLKPIVRMARNNDFSQLERNRAKELNAYTICQKRIREMKLPMKLVKAEFTLGGGKATFYFYSEQRVDFRNLIQSLNKEMGLKIEMVQIGVRNVAGMIGGIGICGRELCCSTFLTDFKPISIKMAKVQNLSLNPEKVSGCCGRLLCCLQYEYDLYREMGRGLPKVGGRVKSPDGEGRVRSVDILKQLIFVELESGLNCYPLADVERVSGPKPDSKRPKTTKRSPKPTLQEES